MIILIKPRSIECRMCFIILLNCTECTPSPWSLSATQYTNTHTCASSFRFFPLAPALCFTYVRNTVQMSAHSTIFQTLTMLWLQCNLYSYSLEPNLWNKPKPRFLHPQKLLIQWQMVNKECFAWSLSFKYTRTKIHQTFFTLHIATLTILRHAVGIPVAFM